MVALDSFASEQSLKTHGDVFKEATISTFAMFCGESPTCSDGEVLTPPFDGIVGVMSLIGSVSWSLMLGLPRDTAVSMSLLFAGFEIDYDSADMGDVVGELVNVLAGDVSARLDAAGVRADLSLPTVARGSDVHLQLPEAASLVKLTFESVAGTFWLVIGAAASRD